MNDKQTAMNIAYADLEWRVISNLLLECLDQGAITAALNYKLKLSAREKSLGLRRSERGELSVKPIVF